MDWNYDMENCPLDTKVCLLAANDFPILPQREYVGTITLNGIFKTRGECYKGDKDSFYLSKIIAWKEYIEDETIEDETQEIRHWFECEIELAKERMNLEYNSMFNSVEVGHEKQIELNKAHIRFCEYAIRALCK